MAIVRGWTTVTSNRWRQTRVTTSRISLGLQLKRCQSLNSSPRVCGCIWWGWRGIKGSVERWANFGRHPWLFHPLVLRASRRTLVTTALPDGERGIERTQGDEPRPLGHVHNGGAYVVSVSRRLRTCRCVLGRFKIPKIYRMPYNGCKCVKYLTWNICYDVQLQATSTLITYRVWPNNIAGGIHKGVARERGEHAERKFFARDSVFEIFELENLPSTLELDQLSTGYEQTAIVACYSACENKQET